MNFLGDIFNNNPLSDILKNVGGELGNVANTALKTPQNVIASVVGGANTAVKDVVNGAKDISNNAVDKTTNSLNNITGSIFFPVLIAGGLFIVYEIYNNENNTKNEIIKKL